MPGLFSKTFGGLVLIATLVTMIQGCGKSGTAPQGTGSTSAPSEPPAEYAFSIGDTNYVSYIPQDVSEMCGPIMVGYQARVGGNIQFNYAQKNFTPTAPRVDGYFPATAGSQSCLDHVAPQAKSLDNCRAAFNAWCSWHPGNSNCNSKTMANFWYVRVAWIYHAADRSLSHAQADLQCW